MNRSSFGVIGLGVMGKSISLNIADKGFSLSIYNRPDEGEEKIVEEFIHENRHLKDLQGFIDLKAFVNSLEQPRKILIMIKAGNAVDQVLDQLVPELSEGDIVMDGGNSHYEDTKRRAFRLDKIGLHFMGIGISGGEEGALKGPSIMPGGNKKAYDHISPILEAISAKDRNGNPCCTYIGTEGAGHFVKMVHNGIEYAEMQLLAEVYALLSQSMDYQAIAQLLTQWNTGDSNGYLLGITAQILTKKEEGHYLIDLILDQAGNKGTGSWSSKAAFDLGIPNTMMSAAVFARYISSFKTIRAKLAGLYEKKSVSETIDFETLKNAYDFARTVNHIQGFELILQASKTYNWNLSLSEIARIWTNGCIIKSALMERLVISFKEFDRLLDCKAITDQLHNQENAIEEVLKAGLSKRVALPNFSTAYNYWVGMTTERSPANLIQAQRDFFGAHTYQRVDASSDQYFHTNWQ